MSKQITIKSARSDVVAFLQRMKEMLNNPTFNEDREFLFIPERAADDPGDEFTNANTLLALEYDTSDVVNELRRLEIGDYVESIVDNVTKETDIQVFYVFCRIIQAREVYIKVRIKQRKKGECVFCISFHFARHPMTNFPYRRIK